MEHSDYLIVLPAVAFGAAEGIGAHADVAVGTGTCDADVEKDGTDSSGVILAEGETPFAAIGYYVHHRGLPVCPCWSLEQQCSRPNLGASPRSKRSCLRGCFSEFQ